MGYDGVVFISRRVILFDFVDRFRTAVVESDLAAVWFKGGIASTTIGDLNSAIRNTVIWCDRTSR